VQELRAAEQSTTDFERKLERRIEHKQVQNHLRGRGN